jgi:predicted kinase
MTDPKPEAVLLIGIPGAGKSTYASRFTETHVVLSKDTLKTNTRFDILLGACLTAKASFVSDRTHARPETRARIIKRAKAWGFKVIGYYFDVLVEDALDRNRERENPLPEVAVLATAKALVPPTLEEDFDELYILPDDDEQTLVA